MIETLASPPPSVRKPPFASVRVALVHDWLTGMRGGEKVLELICKRFPDAPLWTLLHVPESVSPTINDRKVYPSLLQRMPLVQEKYRNYLPLFPFFAETNRVSGADVVISTSHAVAKGMVHRSPRKPLHICYIHTPMRYAWDRFDDYFGVERVGWFASRCLFKPLVTALRKYDLWTASRVDVFVANSTYVADRVRRIYGRPAEVLAPPVDTERFRDYPRKPGDAYLVVSALVPYKRVDMAIRACHALGRPLRIVGKGQERSSLERLAKSLGADVTFIGFASDDELAGFYSTARALLFPGVEDFGIVPVEALACGCPVIALAEGGVLDSLTRETAVFYNSPSVEGLTEAIVKFESREDEFPEFALRAQAELFSEACFVRGFENLLTRVSVAHAASYRRPGLQSWAESTGPASWVNSPAPPVTLQQKESEAI